MEEVEGFLIAGGHEDVDPIQLVLLFEGAKRLWERGGWPDEFSQGEEGINAL